MKKIFLNILIGFQLSVLASCSHFDLDLAPVSSITDGNFWKSPEQWESFVTGIHARFRTHSYNFFVLGNMRADEFGEVSPGGESTNNRERFWLNTLNADNPGVTNFGDFYSNINQINLLIDRTESTTLLTEANKNYYLGQAYGLRAFYYFHLLRTWGDVVIHDQATTKFDLNDLAKAASPATDVMAFIKSDITKSEAAFANNYETRGTKSLWSKVATLMLKGEVYLWSSRQMGGGSADAQTAKAALQDIQTNRSDLGLLDNFTDVFSHNNKGNKEIIFAVRNNLLEYEIFGGQLWPFLPQINYIGSYYDSLSAKRIDVQVDLVGNAGGWQAPLKRTTYWRFSNDDSRKYVSMQGAFRLENEEFKLAGVYVKKYPGTINAGARTLINDYPIYRYSDLLLMLAEAKSLTSEDPANELNLVRRRAFGTKYDPAVHGFPNKTGDNDVNEAILAERFYEFICEGKRWYDLRRFGKEYVYKYTTVTQEYQLLWPIDLNTLTNNRALKQTNGY